MDGVNASLDLVKEEILRELREDFVGLWEFVGRIRAHWPSANAAQVRTLVIRCVRELLAEEAIQPGFPTPDGRGFQPWAISPDETVAAIELVWDRIGREPTIGEIVWFDRASRTVPPARKSD